MGRLASGVVELFNPFPPRCQMSVCPLPPPAKSPCVVLRLGNLYMSGFDAQTVAAAGAAAPAPCDRSEIGAHAQAPHAGELTRCRALHSAGRHGRCGHLGRPGDHSLAHERGGRTPTGYVRCSLVPRLRADRRNPSSSTLSERKAKSLKRDDRLMWRWPPPITFPTVAQASPSQAFASPPTATASEKLRVALVPAGSGRHSSSSSLPLFPCPTARAQTTPSCSTALLTR